jgi:hypothetical protein
MIWKQLLLAWIASYASLLRNDNNDRIAPCNDGS